MNESIPKVVVAPRWIVHADGRVSEFEQSQLAADLYRARCLHRREGAALFAAELSAAVMHFASQEFASPVWRSDRLKRLTVDLLRELGHAETAEAWLQRRNDGHADDRALAYSPDLVGLVEEGVLDFDLRLDDARLALNVVDAIEFAGAARSADEFLEGLRPVLADAATGAERVLVSGLCIGAALLRNDDETPEEVAAGLVSMIVESIASTLTPTAIDLRCQGDEMSQLSGGPLFPFSPPRAWAEFHRGLIDALPRQVARFGRAHAPLCVVASTSPESPVREWRSEWKSQGADFKATLLIGLSNDAIESPRPAEIVVHLPKPTERSDLGSKEDGVLSSVVRAAAQRFTALRRQGFLGSNERREVIVFFSGWHPPYFRNACRHRLQEFAKPHGISVRFVPPCRVWWGEEIQEFCRDLSDSRDARAADQELWYLRPDRPRSTYFLIPRREST